VAEGVLLVAIIAIDRGRIDRWSAAGRALSLGLMAVLVASAAVAASRLVVDLVEGGVAGRFGRLVSSGAGRGARQSTGDRR
jgi:hypothetical protein